MSHSSQALVHALKVEVLAEHGLSSEARELLEAILLEHSERAKAFGQAHFDRAGSNLIYRRRGV